VAEKTQPADDASAMSPNRRSILMMYLLDLGLLLIYALIQLHTLDFPDAAVVVEAPPQSAGIQSPAQPPAQQPSPPTPAADAPSKAPDAGGGAADAGAGAGQAIRTPPSAPGGRRPVLIDVFPHVKSDPQPTYELALYGTDFDDRLQVRLNGRTRAPKTTPRADLILVVPTPGDLVGPGTLVVEVVNPGGILSNALALKVDRPKLPLSLLGWEWPITREVQLILMVLCAGALGSYVHAMKSIADFIGNRTAMTSWFWWYITRPFLGGTMAFIFYAVLRGGFLTGTPADVRVVNPFGAIAVAALVGMFADKAAQKLAEIFETLFKAEEKRSGKLAAPVIDRLVPSTVLTGNEKPIDLKIVGDRLGNVRTVKVDGKERTSERVSDKEVIVKLQPDDLKKSGALSISVVTADATSPSASLQVTDLDITTASLPTGKVGDGYSEKLAATAGTPPYGWSMEGAG
jgi:hypothetical protein